jgi:hypothetical protein
LGQATGVGIAAEMRGDRKGKIKSSSNKEAGAECQSLPAFPRGEGEELFLDILFHRMSEMAIFRQSK